MTIPLHALVGEVECMTDWLPPYQPTRRELISYAYGGVDIGDASSGLNVKTWTGVRVGNDIRLRAEGVAERTIISVPNVATFGFAFDHNMRPFICYELGYVGSGDSRFYWYDPDAQTFVTTALPQGSVSPRCVHDDVRPGQADVSDVVLTYIRNGVLYTREQQTAYEVEYSMRDGLDGYMIGRFGMNLLHRLQWEYRALPAPVPRAVDRRIVESARDARVAEDGIRMVLE